MTEVSDISLIIPTYRNPKYLDLCLKSATENKVSENTNIIVVVDGYMEESEDILKKYSVAVLDLVTNHGMQHAINLGVMSAETKYVFVINDDNVLPREWDVRLSRELFGCNEKFCQNDKFMLTVNQIEPVGPSMFHHHIRDLGQTSETFHYDTFLLYEKTLSQSLTAKFARNFNGHIFPFAIEKKWYLSVGGLDTFYGSPQVCDWDMALKLELLGFSFPRTYALQLYHFGSVVTRKNAEGSKFREREAKAHAEYEYKWGAQLYNKPIENSKIPPNRKFRGFIV